MFVNSILIRVFSKSTLFNRDRDVDSFPLIGPGGTEAFQRVQTDEYFLWKVYSTVGFSENRPSGVDWTWDHISFGFNCPRSNLYLPPKDCVLTTKECTSNIPMSRSLQYEYRSLENRTALPNLIDQLCRKIHLDILRPDNQSN